MDEHRRKSIQRKSEAIFKKAEDREKAGRDYFDTGWQAKRRKTKRRKSARPQYSESGL